jgi:NIPSNAP
MVATDPGTLFSMHRGLLPGGPTLAMALLATGCGSSTGPTEPGERGAGGSGGAQCCPIVELRQYTLQPGQRDVLIDLFDSEFIETQEATGMAIIGQFRDLGRADRFVWLRGFADMPSRTAALQAFYGGPVWKAHRTTANATMIDSDNVLLLRPARPHSGFALADRRRPPREAREPRPEIVAATICSFDAPVREDFIDFFERQLVPVLAEAGAAVEAYLVTESSPNGFPALPVREGENVFVWLSRFADRPAHERHVAALARSARWRELSRDLERRLSAPPQALLLSPTSRSLL